MMNGHMDTHLGKVTIDHDVIATYAGSVAVECFGIVPWNLLIVNYEKIKSLQ